ncbi:helix-turn-helix transcriptional regulator [Saccharopolyspora sp. NPDC047091]|uniref:helix-turn-helix domain-containing protein n=1 Tax=Saccharopolyspora sp. NPDC047091 TaxID=3155924 RepID=UPI0033D57811
MPKFAGSQARAIGAEMRRARDSLEWTLETLAAATDISRSTLSRIETGARRADVGEVASILTALAVTGPAKQRLLRLAGDTSETWVGVGSAVTSQLSAVSSYEAEAHEIHEFQVSVIPGLLQTASYARALFGSTPLGSAERERGVFYRVERQATLRRSTLRSYNAFLDETALRRKVTTDEKTMSQQFHNLLAVAACPGRSVRVIPFSAGAYWGCEGPFILYALNDHHVAYHENQSSGVFIDGEATDVYQQVLNNLDNVALDQDESNELITSYLKEQDHGLRVPQE